MIHSISATIRLLITQPSVIITVQITRMVFFTATLLLMIGKNESKTDLDNSFKEVRGVNNNNNPLCDDDDAEISAAMCNMLARKAAEQEGNN